jgi:RimJ/RimL family protein N-acetyltransferase
MQNLEFQRKYVFENERALLRPLQSDDFEYLLPIALRTPQLLKYSPSPFGDVEKLRMYIEKAVAARGNHRRYPFIIFDKQHQEYAGSTSFGNVSNYDRRLEIGWTWIDPKFQGTGLNRASKQLLIDFTFHTLQFERVEFKIDSRNIKSRKAVEKLGATFEGELRSHTLMNDGYRRSTVYYGILKDEWDK